MRIMITFLTKHTGSYCRTSILETLDKLIHVAKFHRLTNCVVSGSSVATGDLGITQGELGSARHIHDRQLTLGSKKSHEVLKKWPKQTVMT